MTSNYKYRLYSKPVVCIMIFYVIMANGCQSKLQIASLNNDINKVKNLIAEGADVDETAPNGATALHNATSNGNIAIVRLLIERGADVNKKSISGITPLHNAASNGKLEIVKMLIERGADVDEPAANGATPLHNAAFNGNLEVAKLLMEMGADVNKEMKDGITPLHNAAFKGNITVVRLLIERGADVNKKSVKGITPLHNARLKGNFRIAKMLEESGKYEFKNAKKGYPEIKDPAPENVIKDPAPENVIKDPAPENVIKDPAPENVQDGDLIETTGTGKDMPFSKEKVVEVPSMSTIVGTGEISFSKGDKPNTLRIVINTTTPIIEGIGCNGCAEIIKVAPNLKVSIDPFFTDYEVKGKYVATSQSTQLSLLGPNPADAKEFIVSGPEGATLQKEGKGFRLVKGEAHLLILGD